MKKKVTSFLAVALALVLLGFTACGGADDAATPTPSPTPVPQPLVQQEIPVVATADWMTPEGLIRGLEGELVVAGAARQFNVSDPDMGGVFAYFQEFYPNFRTRLFDRGSEGGAVEHLQQLIAAGTPPDVFITCSSNMPNIVRLGLAQDLTPFIEEFSEFRDSLIPNAFALNRVRGRYYGVVWQFLPRAFVTNVDIFDRLGLTLPGHDWTVEEFVELNQRVSQNRNMGISGVQGELHILAHQFAMAYNVNASRFEGDLELSAWADDPNAITAFEMLGRALYAYDTQFTYAERQAFGPAWNSFFMNGHSAWQPWSVWAQPVDRQTGQSYFNWTVLPPPVGPQGHRGGNSDTITMSIFPGSPNAELAFRYIMASTSHHFYRHAEAVYFASNPPRGYPAGFRVDETRWPVGLPPQNIQHVTYPAFQSGLEGFMRAAEYMAVNPYSVVQVPHNQFVVYVIEQGSRSIADMLREYDNWRNGYLRAGQ